MFPDRLTPTCISTISNQNWINKHTVINRLLQKSDKAIKNKFKFNYICLPMRVVFRTHPADIYLLRVNNRNTRPRCEIFSKLTINTTERRQ